MQKCKFIGKVSCGFRILNTFQLANSIEIGHIEGLQQNGPHSLGRPQIDLGLTYSTTAMTMPT